MPFDSIPETLAVPPQAALIFFAILPRFVGLRASHIGSVAFVRASKREGSSCVRY